MKTKAAAHANVVRSVLLAPVWLSLVLFAGCNSANFNPPPETIAATSGTPQSAALNTPFAAPLVATVTMGSTPVAGAFVVFTAPATGASGTFSNGTNTETDTTDSSGVVSTTFTANGTIGSEMVTASVAGVTATTTFSLTNTSGPAASIAATSGSLQDATVGTPFVAPLIATVVDSNQNPVSGASVTFTAPSSGASGTFANATNTETDTTDANGMAKSSTFTANATAGGYAVAATTAGATPASFSLTNITGAVISITATSGTPQSASVNAAFAAPLAATVMANGAPVTGALVTFEVPAAGPSGTFTGGVTTATTDVNGVATSAAFTANGSVGTYTVTATVASGAQPANFILTNTAINFAFYVSGLEALNQDFNGGPSFYALAGSVTVDGNGNILGGEQDYNDGLGLNSPEPLPDNILPGTAALVVDPTTGQGTLTLTTDNPNLGQSGVETLGVQFVNTNHALIIQFDGSATSSGSMDKQTLASALNDGNYAFTLSGVDPSYFTIVFGGVFSISGGGASVQGTFDVDDAGAATTPTLGTSFSGSITAPDAFGRGTITSGLAMTLNYYVVGPEAMRIIDVDVDAGDSAIGSVYGQGAGTFSNASLGSSIFGVESNSFGNFYAVAGMFATDPVGGTLSGVADDNEYYNGVIVPQAPISGNYSVAGNGYGSLTITPGDLGDVSVMGIYLTDPLLNLNDPNNTTSGLGGGLVAELDGFDLSGTGVLTPQTDTSTASLAGSYAFGAQAYNDPRGPTDGWEFDFVGQGLVSGGALSGTSGLLSDPFFIFNNTPPDGTDTATFSGTVTPDPANAGRYTMKLGITVSADPNFNVAIYQASGGQLLWLDENANDESVFLGPLEQQGSLAGFPAAKKARAKTKSRQK